MWMKPSVAVDPNKINKPIFPNEETKVRKDAKVNKGEKPSVEEANKEIPDNGEVDETKTVEEDEKPSTVEEKGDETEPPPARRD